MPSIPERFKTLASCVLIAAVCVAVYVPWLGNEFVSLDDGLLITRNPAVQQLSLRSLTHVFTTYDPELYVPLTLVSYQLEHAVFGLNPTGFHVTNLLLHALNALLVCAVVASLLRSRGAGLAAGLLFAAHPLHAEAVLWASARKDVLSSCFFLCSWLSYLRFCETEEKKWSVAGIATFLLALLSKVSVILLPVVLVLTDVLQERRLDRAAWREKIPYAVLSVLFGIIAVGGKTRAIAGIGPLQTALLSAKSVVMSIGKLLLPAGLSPIYPQLTPVTIASPEFLLSVIGCALLLAAAWMLRRRSPAAAFGIVFFLVMQAPSFSTFFKNGFLFYASDRYAYLASIGIFVVLVVAGRHVLSRLPRGGMLGGWAVGVLTVMLGAFAFAQGAVWQNSESLYRHVTTLFPGSAMAHNNLGSILRETGDTVGARLEIDAAMRLAPDLLAARMNDGLLLRNTGSGAGALAAFRTGVAVLEGKETLTVDEIPAFYYLGEQLEISGDDAGALEQFREAARRMPEFAETHWNLGLQLQKRGRISEAIGEFRSSVEHDPLLIDARYRLAALLAESGSLAEAEIHLAEVVRQDAGYERAAEHLRNIRAMHR